MVGWIERQVGKAMPNSVSIQGTGWGVEPMKGPEDPRRPENPHRVYSEPPHHTLTRGGGHVTLLNPGIGVDCRCL